MAACSPGSCSESACRLLHSVQARGQHVGAPQVSELLIRICARIGATESRRRGSTESVALPKVRCWLLGSGAWLRSGLLRKPVSYPGGPPTLRRFRKLNAFVRAGRALAHCAPHLRRQNSASGASSSVGVCEAWCFRFLGGRDRVT